MSLQIDEAHLPAGFEPGTLFHPTFLYELVWNVAICVLLVWLDRRFRLGGGLVFALYVAGYTLGRFFIELIRTDAATEVFGGLRINTVTSAVVFLGALVVLWMLRHRRREAPEEVRGGQELPDGTDGDDRAGAGATAVTATGAKKTGEPGIGPGDKGTRA